MTTEVINGIEVIDYRDHAADNISSTIEELRTYLTGLMEERDNIQGDIDTHSAVLRGQKNVGMDGPLLDKEQYPRGDIDLIAVRTSRQQMIRLTNDMRNVMDKIQSALMKLHKLTPAEQVQARPQAAPLPPRPVRPPFVRVQGVIPQSPAAQSGLRDNDQICQIGSLHKDNFTGLGDVAEVVKLSVNKAVAVKLVRDGVPKTIALMPREWQGRGVLGCNVVDI